MQINAIAEMATDKVEAFEHAIRTMRDKCRILIAVHRFKPYTTLYGCGDSVLLVRTRFGLQPASKMSPLLRSLEQAWKEDVHMHAFTTTDNEMNAAEVISAMNKALESAPGSSASKQAVGKRKQTRKNVQFEQ
jgi:hypothetical protein